MGLYGNRSISSVSTLFERIATITARPQTQTSLRSIQERLDANYSPLIIRGGDEPFQAVTEEYFRGLHDELSSSQGSLLVEDLASLLQKESVFPLYDAAFLKHSYYRTMFPAMHQGKNQIESLAFYYLACIHSQQNSLVVFNVLGNNSREGVSLAISVHQKMVEMLLESDLTPDNRGKILLELLQRTVFLNTGAAGKGVTMNQIRGWIISAAGPDLNALHKLIFNQDSVGIFTPKITSQEGVLLTEEFCNLKQFGVKNARLFVERNPDGTYLATMRSVDNQQVFFQHLPIRAAGKVAQGVPNILIGSTEADMNAHIERQYFSRLGKTLLDASRAGKIVIPKNTLSVIMRLNPPILCEYNSSNTGENAVMGPEKLVDYLLMRAAIQTTPNLVPALQEALTQCEESNSFLRVMFYPRTELERTISQRMKSKLDQATLARLELFALVHEESISSQLSEANFATTQAGPQSCRFGTTILHQMKNIVHQDKPAFRTATALLTMFDPALMPRMSNAQASFELIAYVKEFWQSFTYLMKENKFHIAKIISPNEFQHWLSLTVDIYNAVLDLEKPVSVEDFSKESLAEVNRFFGDIWAKFETAIPTYTQDEQQQIESTLRVYAVPLCKRPSLS